MTEDAARRVADAVERSDRVLVVLAGPNGAGKTTFFEVFLAELDMPWVNADRIAQRIRPDDTAVVAYEAARSADGERRRLVCAGESFCTETVFSDTAGHKLGFLRQAHAAGFEVVLIFIGLDSPELCSARVGQRVADGGHDVPDGKITARYAQTLVNLRQAIDIVDVVVILDNSSIDMPYRPIATFEQGTLTWRSDRLPTWAAQIIG